ncbi:MAG: gerAC1 [Clostridia bacterium]|jgi:spore germination protein|nr:gerAC1 [Clostridia bacterium]
MKKLLKMVTILIVCSLLLSGCWDQRVFEQVGFTLSYGIEESQDGKLLITSAYPVIGGVEKGSVDIITTKSSLTRGGRNNMRLMTPKLIEGGKVQQVLISDSLAKKGIHDLLEIFQRDVTLPAIAFVVITEGSPGELLKKANEFKSKPRVSFYIYQLLENNVKLSNIPNTKVFDFDINFFAPGLDPIVPMVKVEDEQIKITGCALFSDDKMSGRLNNKESNLLIGLMNQLNNSDFIFSDPKFADKDGDKQGVAVTMFKPKRKISINFDEEGIPSVEINMKYKCNIDEFEWDDTMDPKVQTDLEKTFGDNLTTMSNEIIKKLQTVNCDPIGIGDMIRAKYYDYWKSIDWKEMYPKADIKVSTKVEIGNVGIIK